MSDPLQTERDGEALSGLLQSVVYVSTATVPFSELDLAVLLAASRLNNQARGLSGLLLYRAGRFMQVLEGPRPAMQDVLSKIAADPRHTDVRTLDEEWIRDRRFGSWAMGYRALSDSQDAPVPSWFGSPEALQPQDTTRAGRLLTWFRDS